LPLAGVLVIGLGGLRLRKLLPGCQPGSGSIVSMRMKPLRSQKARVAASTAIHRISAPPGDFLEATAKPATVQASLMTQA
jgi:hypothetical protein